MCADLAIPDGAKPEAITARVASESPTETARMLLERRSRSFPANRVLFK
jgi:hypothetical protein